MVERKKAFLETAANGPGKKGCMVSLRFPRRI